MNLRQSFLHVFIITLIFRFVAQAQTDSVTIWNLDRLDAIGGFVTTVLPNQAGAPASDLPSLINTEYGKAAYFNGINDGFLVKGNPLGTATSFTFEMIFKPDSLGNLEQRVIHIGKDKSDPIRLLLEIRLLKNQQWALDLCMNSGGATLIILDTVHAQHLFPAGQWYHLALVFDNKIATTYINGKKDTSGTVVFNPLTNAQTSIGARQDPKSWFKGAIRLIKSTPRALTPSEFLNISTPTTGVNEIRNKPSNFQLDQNYPNPFNPSTTIRYILPETSYVTLKVYDMLGRQIALLAEGMKETGYHDVVFDGTKLTSGIYFTRFTSQTPIGTAIVQTRKLVLAK